MKRPSVSPPVEPRRDLDIIKRSGNVANDPEDQEQSHPRHAYYHGHVLTGQSQRDHATEIQHPIHDERATSICHRIAFHHIRDLRFTGDGVGMPEVDLESHGHEGVGEGEHEVGAYRSTPSPDNELLKLERRVVFGLEVLHVDGHVEGETEEGYDDEICECC